MSTDTKAYMCSICGEIVREEYPPETCPVCGAKRESFQEVESDDTLFKASEELKIIIVGGGPAGTTAASEIRKRNKACQIEIIGKEDVLGYNRPRLTKGLMKNLDMTGFFIKDYPWYVENKIKITLSTEVTKIDALGKTITLEDGSTRSYDKLIITTGAKSQVPKMEGLELPGVFTLRSLKDVEIIKEYIKTGVKTAAVIGGGVLGLETASELNKEGLKVTLIQRSGIIMRKQLDQEGALFLEDIIKSKGVDIKINVDIKGITGKGKAEGVMVSDQVVPAELVIISAGVIENQSIAEQAGAQVEKGIIVNEKMETSLSDIYAAGDCARFKGKNFALWPEATAMAKVAAQNAVGEDASYEGILPSVSFVGFDTVLFSIGDHGEDETKVYETKENINRGKGVYKKYYFEDGKFVGGILIGDTKALTELLSACKTKKPMDEMSI